MNKEDLKTTYDWCIEKNQSVLGLEVSPAFELEFYTKVLDEDGFNQFIDTITNYNSITIENGLHIKSERYLELRMYSLVPYNLLGIQMGIQHEHSVTQYALNKVVTGARLNDKFVRWASEWKTSIVLNGGTSNEGHLVHQGFGEIWYEGSMQKHLKALKDMKVETSTFYEPDLNSMLTGISFIVDERVFNKRIYTDFKSFEKEGCTHTSYQGKIILIEEYNTILRETWLSTIGGEQNAKLRAFLSQFQLARG